jgi:hypothetical protein
MRANIYPPGWDEQRVRKVIDHFEKHPDEDGPPNEERVGASTLMEVPSDLLSAVRYLIAQREVGLRTANASDGAAGWTCWRNFDTPVAERVSAVYEVRIVDSQRNPIPIPRFLGLDPNGILCIGQTKNMEARRKQFKRGRSGRFGHSEGNLLHILEESAGLKEVHPNARYEYRSLPSEEGSLRDRECSLITRYVRRFGEVPPLNSAIPRRYDPTSWVVCVSREVSETH